MIVERNNRYFVDTREFKEIRKNPFIAAVLSVFLGIFGVHRFYLKRKGSGFIFLIVLVMSSGAPILVDILLILSFVEAIYYVTRGVLLLKEKYTYKSNDVKRGKEINEKPTVKIIDVTNIKTIKIPREEKIVDEDHNDWLRKLELPYERSIMSVAQVKDETLKLYEKLCNYLDKELRKKDSSLNKEIKRIYARGGYYDNILYTIYCISEGHVTKTYSGNYDFYDPEYSYEIIEYYFGRDFREKIYIKAQELEKGIAAPKGETLIHFNLTEDGLPRRWWDNDGRLRRDRDFNDKEVNILNATPRRSTVIWNIYNARKQIISLYLLIWECIVSGLEKDIKWVNKNKDNLTEIISTKNIYYPDYENGNILASLIKISENTIRELVPNTQVLNVSNEEENIKKYLPKEIVSDINNRIVEFKREISSKEIEKILVEMIDENPKDWKAKVERILIADTSVRAGLLIDYRNDENFIRIAKEIIKKIDDEDILLLALYGIGLQEKLSSKNNKLLESILHPTNIQKFNDIQNKKDELSKELLGQLLELKEPIRKKIELDMSKVEVSKKELRETVNIVKDYIGEDEMELVVEAQGETIVEDNNDDKSEFKYTEFLIRILDSGSICIEDGKKIAMDYGILFNAFISDINRELYEYIQDQTIIIEDGLIKIDDFYVDMVRELIVNEI